jgi:hypothetical protein
MLPNRKQVRIILSFAPLMLMFGPTLLRRIAPFPYSPANRKLNDAILRNDTVGVKAALKAGADPNTEMEGWAWTDGVHPFTAAMQGDIHEHLRDTPLLLTMDSLVNRDAKVLKAADQGIPPENLEIVRALVEAGAEVNARSFIGYTPLFQATEWGYTATAVYLLNHGADPNIVTCGNDTPCSDAAVSGRTDLLKELLNRGADPNIPNCIGDTPLHLAALRSGSPQQIAAVQLLLKFHANPKLKNRDGLTPLDIAKQNNRSGIVKVLEQVN